MSRTVLGYAEMGSAKDRGHYTFGTVGDNTPRDQIICLDDIDRLSFQMIWGGTLNGALTIWSSDSYIPPKGANSTTDIRTGDWTNVTARYASQFTNPAGSAGRLTVDLGFVSEGHLRFRFIQASGSGALDYYVTGKALR